MIITKAMDVEIFVNMFSVIFVDMKDYLQTFADCVDDKGRPIPLSDKLSIAEIKRRLDGIKCDTFWISDTDDSQLLDLVSYINAMQAHYETKISEYGEVYQIPVRTDLFGFNNQSYDDLMIKAFMMYFNRFDNTKHLIVKLKSISDTIISLQSDKTLFYENKELELIRKYRLPYETVDLQKVFALHSAGVNIDKDGSRNKYAKSLKQTSINLKWHELLDFKLPPIDQEEYMLYWSKKDNYRGMDLKYINSLVPNDFNRYILPKYIEPMLYYNRNDVFIVCEMARQKPDEIKLRYSITNAFKVNVLCSARANIADKLTTKFYSDRSGLRKEQFIKLRTERTRLSFNKIIFPHIQFKTPELQRMLAEMKQVYVYHTTKSDFSKEITFYGTTYTLACGGIHTKDRPVILKSDENFTYKHFDYNSYYPSIIISYNVYPKHLNKKVFVKMVEYLRDTRVKAKHTKDEVEHVIKGVPNKISAEALKIVINTIYGKLGSELFFLYDRFAQLQVTINGQLMTMTLVEELELNGIHVISANTDGLVIKLPNDKQEKFKEITERWNQINKMQADSEDYKEYVARDVNNYFAIWTNDEVDAKGVLDYKQYIKDLKKGYDMPIVSLAVFNYFVYNTPVMDTLRNHKYILDFCKTQNVGRQFNVVYDVVKDGNIETVESQRHVRFYVSTKGVCIQKEHVTTKKRTNLASGLPVKILNSLDDKPIEERDIDYRYYYNEAYKIIDPIKLGISASQKVNKNLGVPSGKLALKKYARDYLTLFDENDF